MGWGDLLIYKEDNKAMFRFVVGGETRFLCKVPPVAQAHKYFHGNAGEQEKFLLDTYDTSCYHADGVIYRRFEVEFETQYALMASLAHAYGDDCVGLFNRNPGK